MSFITSAIGGISDRHIAEFAFVKPKKIYTGVLMKITAAAACAALIVTGVPRIQGMIYNTNSSDVLNSVADNSLESYVFEPSYLIFNGEKYTLRFVSKELPEGYEKYNVIGEILSVDPADSDKEGFCDCCAVGDLIYQNPEVENIIYVLNTNVRENADPFYRFFAIGDFLVENGRNIEMRAGNSTLDRVFKDSLG